jgi:hypothetical protein
LLMWIIFVDNASIETQVVDNKSHATLNVRDDLVVTTFFFHYHNVNLQHQNQC